PFYQVDSSTGAPTNLPSLLVIPRHPSNLFYNLQTQNQWVSEYNCYYSKIRTDPATGLNRDLSCAGGRWAVWDTDLTYSQILDKESDVWLSYLLRWDLDPLMFHQPNAGDYVSGRAYKSLLTDLINATLQKYNNAYSLPILSPSQHEQGVRMANRMAF